MAIITNASYSIIDNSVTWQSLTLLNSWQNTGGTYAPAAYYKDALGLVRLRGYIRFGIDGIIATLPSGYRPQYDYVYPDNPQNINLSTAKTVIEVRTNGNIFVTGTSGNTYVSLDIISFQIQ